MLLVSTLYRNSAEPCTVPVSFLAPVPLVFGSSARYHPRFWMASPLSHFPFVLSEIGSFPLCAGAVFQFQYGSRRPSLTLRHNRGHQLHLWLDRLLFRCKTIFPSFKTAFSPQILCSGFPLCDGLLSPAAALLLINRRPLPHVILRSFYSLSFSTQQHQLSHLRSQSTKICPHLCLNLSPRAVPLYPTAASSPLTT